MVDTRSVQNPEWNSLAGDTRLQAFSENSPSPILLKATGPVFYAMEEFEKGPARDPATDYAEDGLRITGYT